ncbi:MAG: hypothetical protein Q9166_000699 [cf. Caloplaca sp. 2 TL-2023]
MFSSKLSRDPSLLNFLSSYVEASAQHLSISGSHSKSLRRSCYLLVHRCLLELKKRPPPLLEWNFLSDLSLIYAKSPSLSTLLRDVWQSEDLGSKLQDQKSSLIRNLEDAMNKHEMPGLDITLDRTAALLKSCLGYGQFLMLGSDFIDALSALYDKADPPIRKKLVVLFYRCCLALMDPLEPKFSMLLDHLYSLNPWKPRSSLLSALCSNTPFVRKLRNRLPGPNAVRGKKLVQELSRFEGTNSVTSKRTKPTQSKKGKGIERDAYGHGALDRDVHVHKMSLVTQVQDLFPDLGSGFVLKLLDEYGDDIEQVTAHLLEDSLPPPLKSMDRSETVYAPAASQSSAELGPIFLPQASNPLLPSRRNIHDNDALDRLTISPSQIHRGLKSTSQTADTVLQDRSSAPNKAAILSALAAFDSDDDERDDTYDAADVGGTVDTAMPGSDEVDADLRDKNEEALFRAYKMSPEVFERDAATRRGKARIALRSETGMTDEAIEGWGIMLERDPRRMRRLEANFEMFRGQQRQLDRTSYREGSGTEESDRGEGSSGRGRGRGGPRGRGREGRGGAGGNVAGPADEMGTQVARQRKDANKGGRANHNRRNQRAKKLAQAGFPG